MLRDPEQLSDDRQARRQRPRLLPRVEVEAPEVDVVAAQQRRLVEQREADPCYWRARWLAMLRSDRRTLAEIAELERQPVAAVRDGVDRALRAESGGKRGLDDLEHELAERRRRAPRFGTGLVADLAGAGGDDR